MPQPDTSQEYTQSHEQEFLTPEQQVATRARNDILSHKDAFDAFNIPAEYIQVISDKAVELDVAKYERSKDQDPFVQMYELIKSSVNTDEDRLVAERARTDMEMLRSQYKSQLSNDMAPKEDPDMPNSNGISLYSNQYQARPISEEFINSILRKMGIISAEQSYSSLRQKPKFQSWKDDASISYDPENEVAYFLSRSNNFGMRGWICMRPKERSIRLSFNRDQMVKSSQLPSSI